MLTSWCNWGARSCQSGNPPKGSLATAQSSWFAAPAQRELAWDRRAHQTDCRYGTTVTSHFLLLSHVITLVSCGLSLLSGSCLSRVWRTSEHIHTTNVSAHATEAKHDCFTSGLRARWWWCSRTPSQLNPGRNNLQGQGPDHGLT